MTSILQFQGSDFMKGKTGQAGLEAAFQVPMPCQGTAVQAGSISNYCLTQEIFHSTLADFLPNLNPAFLLSESRPFNWWPSVCSENQTLFIRWIQLFFDFYLIIFIWKYNFSQMYYIRGCESEGRGEGFMYLSRFCRYSKENKSRIRQRIICDPQIFGPSAASEH